MRSGGGTCFRTRSGRRDLVARFAWPSRPNSLLSLACACGGVGILIILTCCNLRSFFGALGTHHSLIDGLFECGGTIVLLLIVASLWDFSLIVVVLVSIVLWVRTHSSWTLRRRASSFDGCCGVVACVGASAVFCMCHIGQCAIEKCADGFHTDTHIHTPSH